MSFMHVNQQLHPRLSIDMYHIYILI